MLVNVISNAHLKLVATPSISLHKKLAVKNARIFQLLLLLISFFTVFISDSTIASEGEITVYDINTKMDYWSSSHPSESTEYNGKMYFTAWNEIYGRELWVYDGDTDKTTLVTDIISGPSSSVGTELITYGDKLYFSARDGIHGYELWAYDSKTNQANLVLDIHSGAENSNSSDFILYNNKLYFLATDTEHGRELWIYDNLTNKANLVADISPDESSSKIKSLVTYNNKLYFILHDNNDQYDRKLWGYDDATNTASAINEVNDIIATVYELVFYNQKLYIDGKNLNDNYSLYIYDSKTKNIDIAINMTGSNYTVYESKLYFSNHGQTNNLWSYDSRNSELKSYNWSGICDSELGCYPGGMIVYQDKLYFNGLEELYAFDNKTQQVEFVTDAPHYMSASLGPPQFFVYRDRLYLSGFGSHGQELYFYDSVTNEIDLLFDISQMLQGSKPNYLTVYNDKLYFSADDGEHGSELWLYDKLDDTAQLVANINSPQLNSRREFDSDPRELTVYQNKIYFSAEDGNHGRELWVYDDSTNKATMVKDLNPGSAGSSPDSLTVYNNQLCFVTYAPTDSLWCYNNEGEQLKKISEADHSTELTIFNDKLFFYAFERDEGYQLKSYNVQTNATTKIATFEYRPSHFTAYNDTLYFYHGGGYPNYHGELWQYKDSAKTVSPVINLTELGLGRLTSNMTVYNDKLYLEAISPNLGSNLWSFNAKTEAFEQQTFNEKGASDQHDYGPIIIYKNRLYYSGYEQSLGSELWVYDSQDNSTNLAADIFPGFHDSYPKFTTIYDNALWGNAAVSWSEYFAGGELVKFSMNREPIVETSITHRLVEEENNSTIKVTATDLDQDELTYNWTQTSGSMNIDLSGITTELNFQAPQVQAEEVYRFEVTVSDGTDEVKTSVDVTVTDSKSSGGAMFWLILLISIVHIARLKYITATVQR